MENFYVYNDELYHHGVLGMKWGIRRYQPYSVAPRGSGKGGKFVGSERTSYRSTSLRAAVAKRKNRKIDKSFKKWKENDKKRADAIELGKKRNEARLALEKDPKNKELKTQAKQANKDYKKAFRSNTTYRKGQIKNQVESDLSRKHLSKAKEIEKQLKQDPGNKALKKEYQKYMNLYDVERAKARKAPEKYANASKKVAVAKAQTTRAVKSTAKNVAINLAKQALLGSTVSGVEKKQEPQKISKKQQQRKAILNEAAKVADEKRKENLEMVKLIDNTLAPSNKISKEERALFTEARKGNKEEVEFWKQAKKDILAKSANEVTRKDYKGAMDFLKDNGYLKKDLKAIKKSSKG